MQQSLQCGARHLDLTEPVIMGVVNVTPDSFSDGGRYSDLEAAYQQARALVEQGAAIIDIGGESTRPGAAPVPVAEELRRVIPLLEALRELDCILSIDTRKPEVMAAAVAAGADMINDVNALRADGALEAVRDSSVAVCLMHMQGQPQSMQQAPHYTDVVAEVRQFLQQRAEWLVEQGIDRSRLVLDPGFGFGKTLAHNQALFRALPDLVRLEFPVLVGVSRKSMIGALLQGRPVAGRLQGSVTAALLAAQAGARILRVHDVAETHDALTLWQALR